MANNKALQGLVPFSGLFKKTVSQRQTLLVDTANNAHDVKSPEKLDKLQANTASGVKTPAGLPASDSLKAMLSSGGLDVSVADHMIENCVGILGLPLGVAPTFVINNEHYVVPMVTEEPSVIAAASGAAKLIAESAGGFTATSTGNIMTGQVQLLDLSGDLKQVVDKLLASKQKLIARGNTFCANMAKRGGGVRDIEAFIRQPRESDRKIGGSPFVVVHIQVDVCDAMGANIVNTVAEGLAPDLAELSGGRAGLKILSNLCTGRMTTSSFRIPVKSLEYKGFDGSTVAARMLEACYFAEDDVFRATTNNKGIMNGTDAVAVATGQDWRAIEAGAHAYAARNGYYGPLSSYKIETEEYFVGSITLPLAVGTVGGPLQTHPIYKFTHQLLRNPGAQRLAQIIASTGLASNFAAVRALAVEGIQKGHMALHARNIAIAAGAPTELVNEVANHLVKINKIDKDAAAQYLKTRQAQTAT